MPLPFWPYLVWSWPWPLTFWPQNQISSFCHQVRHSSKYGEIFPSGLWNIKFTNCRMDLHMYTHTSTDNLKHNTSMTFHLLTSKSSQFILVPKCTTVLNMVKFSQVVYEISHSQTDRWTCMWTHEWPKIITSTIYSRWSHKNQVHVSTYYDNVCVERKDGTKQPSDMLT